MAEFNQLCSSIYLILFNLFVLPVCCVICCITVTIQFVKRLCISFLIYFLFFIFFIITNVNNFDIEIYAHHVFDKMPCLLLHQFIATLWFVPLGFSCYWSLTTFCYVSIISHDDMKNIIFVPNNRRKICLANVPNQQN